MGFGRGASSARCAGAISRSSLAGLDFTVYGLTFGGAECARREFRAHAIDRKHLGLACVVRQDSIYA